MTVDELMMEAKGNGKRVAVFKVSRMPADWRDGRAWPASYSCEVSYDDDPDLDFSDRFETRAAADRWFRTWSKLATWEAA